MTLAERLNVEKSAAAQLSQRYQAARGQVLQMEQEIIRTDARMALLEQLMADAEQATTLKLVQPEAV